MPALVSPRPYQVPFVDDVVDMMELEETMGLCAQAPPGFGKTICFLLVASRLGLKTLVLVHNEVLMTQWVKRILGEVEGSHRLGVEPNLEDPQGKVLDIGPEQVGIVQQNKCEWEGRSIVIAMAQSIAAREYEQEFYESFGLVGVDECHRFSAPTFQSAIALFPGAKRLGVTATPSRKDGLEDIFFAHIGPIRARGKAEMLTPRINQVKTPVVSTDQLLKRLKSRGRYDYVKHVSFLVDHGPRNDQIVRLLVKAAKKGRKVLLLSGRREHLSNLKELFEAAMPGVETTLYVGGMKSAERQEAEKKQVLFATYNMAEEGLDIPSLDTLFLTTPRGEVVQAAGRVLRLYDDKLTPLIVDFVDRQLPLCDRMANKRRKGFEAQGWKLA